MSAENNFLLALMVAAVGLLSLAFLYGGHHSDRDRLLRKWVVSALLAGSGFLLVGLRGPLPDLFALAFGSLLFLGGFANFHDGVRLRFGLESLSRRSLPVASIVAGLLLYFAYLRPNFPGRVSVVAVATAAIGFATALLLWRHRSRQLIPGRPLLYLLVFAYVAAGLTCLAVIPAALAEPVELPGVRNASVWIQGFWTVTGSLNVIASVTLGLLLFAGIRRDLEASEQRLQLALDAANEGLWDWNLETDEIYLSPRFLAMAGYRAGEVEVDRDFVRRIVHPDDRERVRAGMETRLGGFESSMEVEYRMLTRDGGIRWVVGKGKVTERDGEGRPVRYVGTIADISDRKAAEERLRESEARHRFLAENAHDVIWTLDLETRRITYISPSVERMLGAKVDEIIGHDPFGTLLPGSVDRARKGLERTLDEIAEGERGNLTRFIEVEHPRPDGRVVQVEMVIKYVLDEAGKPVSLVGISRDITERKRVDAELSSYRQHLEDLVAERTRELSQAKEIAEAANRAKSTFLANMSHELRTPLNAILGMTDLALRRASDDKQKDQLAKVTEASRHLLGIISDILDISRVEADRLELQETDFTLDLVVEDALAIVGPRASAKGLRMVTDLSPDLVGQSLRGDRGRLGQVLLNLMGNAVKFTPRGSVTLRAAAVSQGAADVMVRFEVKDTGIGIPAPDRQRLFQAFEQADGSSTRRFGGTGLGLAISRSLARLMGGDIGVDSVPGVGSTFWFTVRLARGQEAPRNAVDAGNAERELRRRFLGARVLLAEDEPVNQEVSRLLLEDAGLRVDVAENGAEALDLARRNEYSIILMDLQMPIMNGLEATRAIRALEGRRTIPILALTANAFDEDRQASRAAGMDDHVSKPVEPEVLFATVLRWLSQAEEAPA
ncbi:MAG: PAS domain S-box protein [Rhodocyclaceae bacterium]|nr:PAS domain S-box protein [Rhodocyclaceae bacterium]